MLRPPPPGPKTYRPKRLEPGDTVKAIKQANRIGVVVAAPVTCWRLPNNKGELASDCALIEFNWANIKGDVVGTVRPAELYVWDTRPRRKRDHRWRRCKTMDRKEYKAPSRPRVFHGG